MNLTLMSEKLLLMGLGESGKSTLASIVFKGKKPSETTEYKATLGYEREIQNFLGDDIQIFDCGGQDSYINELLGEKAEFMFSNVRVLVWIVDSSNFENFSNSRFYYRIAVQKLKEYSPYATIFCLFNKMDLILENKREQVFETMEDYFEPPVEILQKNYSTSIYDQSIYDAFGKVLKHYVSSSPKLVNLSDSVENFIQEHGFPWIAVHTIEGMPVIEGGKNKEPTKIPLSVFISTIGKNKDEYGNYKVSEGIFKVDDDDYVIIKLLKGDLVFSLFVNNVTSLDVISSRINQMCDTLNKFL